MYGHAGLPITPEQLFEVFADAESWPHWATVITDVEWTSPEPRGVGTARTVTMRGGIIGDEEFLAWEPFSHMAFRFNTASTASPPGWACRWAGRSWVGCSKKFLHNLRDYSAKRFAVT